MAYDVTKYFMLILKTQKSHGEKHIESFHLSTEAYNYFLNERKVHISMANHLQGLSKIIHLSKYPEMYLKPSTVS